MFIFLNKMFFTHHKTNDAIDCFHDIKHYEINVIHY